MMAQSPTSLAKRATSHRAPGQHSAHKPATETDFAKFTFRAPYGRNKHDVCPATSTAADERNVLAIRRPSWIGVLREIKSKT